ncbi:MAG: hypothetical protein V3S64_00535 [bacterium]
MPGKPKLHRFPTIFSCLLALALLCQGPGLLSAKDLRRSMPFLRNMLMGGVAVALGDESTSMWYNPAGPARLEASTIEAFTIQLSADEVTKQALTGDSDVGSRYENLTAAELAQAVGDSNYTQLTLKLPVVVNPKSGVAWGLAVDSLVDMEIVDLGGDYGILLEAYVDYQIIASRFGRIGNSLFLGGTFKVINRIGVNKSIDSATLYSSGEFDLESDADVQDFFAGRSRTRVGLDLGLIYQVPGSDNWQTRFGFSVMNIGGYDSDTGISGIEFGSRPSADAPPIGGELPLNIAFGFAVSPTYGNVRFTFALDVVDLGEDALSGDSLSNRTRIGMEIGFGPKKDGAPLFSLLFGWNATHFGGGFITRISFVEIGMGSYTVERGSVPDENPQRRRVILIGFRF